MNLSRISDRTRSHTLTTPPNEPQLKRPSWLDSLITVCLIFLCLYTIALHAAPSDEWVTIDAIYNDHEDFSGAAQKNGVLSSPPLGFKPKPGDYKAYITNAWIDDWGNIGGIQTPDNGSTVQAPWPHPAITDGEIPFDQIVPKEDHLEVNITAYDVFGPPIGWANVHILWVTRCSGCSSCQDLPGGLVAGNKCVSLSMSLGKDSFSQNAGQLRIDAERPSPLLATPAGLQAFTAFGVERINDSGGNPRQIRTSQLFADIVVSNDFAYTISFYSPTNVSPVLDTNGLYTPIGAPYSTVIIQNPDASTNSYYHLQINESGDLGDHQFDYVWSDAAQDWSLASGGGLRTQLRAEGWNGTTNYLTATNTIINEDGSVASKEVDIYKIFPWGVTNRIQRVVDPDGLRPLTNTWTYGEDTNNPITYQKLAAIRTSTGYWERYEYSTAMTNIMSGMMTKKVAQFLDVETNAPESQCRVTTYNIAAYGPITRTTTIQSLLGHEIQRSYHDDFQGGSRDIICQTSGADTNAADNLITTTLMFTNGSFSGRNCLVTRPDGTITSYQYSTNSTSMTTVTSTGAPDEMGTNVVDGTASISVTDLGGYTISNATYDVASGLLLSSSVTLQKDFLGRPTVTQYNDGTTETNRYGCCGLESKTDRDGTVTTYTYNALKRVATMTRAGITTIYTYDAAGRTLTTVRQGADGSQILQNISKYDAAGHLLTSTNALGYGTTNIETIGVGGDVIKTTVNPDGSTRIETHAQDGSLLSVTGTAVFGVRYEYGVEIPPSEGIFRSYVKEIKLAASGADTSEWTKTYTDTAGRGYKTLYPSATNSPMDWSFYNNKGQLVRQSDPDGISTLYQYNTKGEVEFTATDMNGNGTIDFAGTDQISGTISEVMTNTSGVVLKVTRTYAWATNNSAISNLVSISSTSDDGLESWSVLCHNSGGLTNFSIMERFPATASSVITNFAPDGSFVVTSNQYGRVVSTIRFDSGGIQIGQAVFGYDPHGRQNLVTDARNGTTTNFFDAADQVIVTATPSPDGIQASRVMTNYFDSMGRSVGVRLPDGTSVTNIYFQNDLLQKTYGSRTHPVEYEYDYAGRLKAMTTWTNFATSGGAAVTTWNYDLYRGWLSSKAYADGRGPSYYYSPGGRLIGRLWARNLLTSYSYGNAGEIEKIDYSDSTPSVYFGFDRLGRQTSVTNGHFVTILGFDDAGSVLSQSYFGGPLGGLSVTNGYDQFLRRTNLALLHDSTLLTLTTYSFDAISRMQTVSDGTSFASYGYVANSPLVGQIAFTNGNTSRMTTSKSYDLLNRLTSITNSVPGSQVIGFSYAYNSANQRNTITNADGTYWLYSYDSLGQVTSGKKYWSDGTPVAGQQFEYGFDDIGNRTNTPARGDDSGANLRTAAYTANNLNQYLSRTVPGAVDIIGSANSNATVTVNNHRAYRHGNYYRDELVLDNSGSSVFALVTNMAVLNVGDTNADIATTNVGGIFLPKTPELFGYDADGNLASDGRWTYKWDAENRLIFMESLGSTPPESRLQLSFTYDSQGRRTSKVVSVWNLLTLSYQPSATNYFIYDGWNLIAEFAPNAPAPTLLRSYLWGLDLSGTPQGAGGVGGLLSMSVHSGPDGGTYFYTFDGNGNVAALINAADGSTAAQYERGPFGETIRSSGQLAFTNPFRFSTKFQDDETGFFYYGYRFYDPSIGRWLSRDPIEEQGSRNLYSLLNNNPLNHIDPLGLASLEDILKVTQLLNNAALACACCDRNLSKEIRDKYNSILDDNPAFSELLKDVKEALEEARSKAHLNNETANGIVDKASEADEAVKLVFEKLKASPEIAETALTALKGVAGANKFLDHVEKTIANGQAITSGDSLEIFLQAGTYISKVPGPAGQLSKFIQFYSKAYKRAKQKLADLAYSEEVIVGVGLTADACQDGDTEEARINWDRVKGLIHTP